MSDKAKAPPPQPTPAEPMPSVGGSYQRAPNGDLIPVEGPCVVNPQPVQE